MIVRSSLACVSLLVLTGAGAGTHPQTSSVQAVASPDGDIEVTVTIKEQIRYHILWRGMTLIEPSPLSLSLADGTIVGVEPRLVGMHRQSVDRVVAPVVPEKTARIQDRFHELVLDFAGGWSLEVRVYDDGVAYRFSTEREGEIVVAAEEFTAAVHGDPMIWFPTEESFLTHSERLYEHVRLSEIASDKMASLPVLLAFDDGPKVAITEADLREYPGLYLTGSGGPLLTGILPAYPLAEELSGDRTVRVTQRAEYLARTSGPRSFPWRVFVIAEEDGDLIESTMVYRLAPPLEIADPSWINPGQVAWDWWNALNLYDVDFRAGLNTVTYRYFIDFAANHGIEYIILDEGWSTPSDLWELNPDIDLEALFAHAKARGVGIIPWVVWKTLDDRLDEALDRFADWGAAGIKVDFMQRDDQPMVEYYWRVAKAAAERRLLVDFHGAYKPTGLRRAYPNVLTREGVLGLEHSKWSPHPSPEHNVTLPFTRLLAGPMDYTPGAMINAQERQFHPVFDRPMSMGTRVHQLALYVVFESPLQMLADSPSHYLREAECLDFITSVPTVWDETRALTAQVGDWVAVARRRGTTWYVGAMTDWTPRELEIDLSFLGEGEWQAVIFEDGINADRNANDYGRSERTMRAGNSLRIALAPGGGWAARFERRP